MSGVSSRGTPPRSALTELLKKPKVPADWGKPYCLWIHDDYVSTLELVLNPELFPDIKVGECVALVKPTNGLRIVILVSSTERGPFKQSSFQVGPVHPECYILSLFPSRYPCINRWRKSLPLSLDGTFSCAP